MTTATSPKAEARPSDSLSNEQLLDMLKRMMLIRRFEERCAQSYQQSKIGGFCHIYIGQEACAVGAISALKDEDPVVGAYRDHGHALARGMDPNHAMAEMFGKITGCAKGKGGSMHMFDKPHNMYGGHAIVGGQCPLGAGLGWAIKYTGREQVALCFLGDGALNQGAFHESMNLAAIWDLPVLFVLENNMYSMGTHISRGTSMAHDLSAKAKSYGMRYAKCDGMDVLATYDAVKQEADQTRGGDGPAFINVETYRYQGHSMSDPQKYRTKDEVGEFEEQDCINTLVNWLVEHDKASQDQLDDMDKAAKKAATDSVKFAEESEEISTDELHTDVYKKPWEGSPYKVGKPHPDYDVPDQNDR